MTDPQLEFLLSQVEDKIESCNDINQLDNIAERYGKVNHPLIGYRLGEKYLILGAKEKGMPHLVNCVCYGLDPNSIYLLTGYANDIAQSMWYLLRYYDYKSEFDLYKYKLFCAGYACLSICIMSTGVNAFNSLQTRAHMIDQFNKMFVKKMLGKYYYDGADLCTEILTISDYFLASKGFGTAGEEKDSDNCLRLAKKNMEHIINLPQYVLMKKVDIEVIVDVSIQNQDHLVKNLAPDFVGGKFQMTSEDLRNAIMNFCITI